MRCVVLQEEKAKNFQSKSEISSCSPIFFSLVFERQRMISRSLLIWYFTGPLCCYASSETILHFPSEMTSKNFSRISNFFRNLFAVALNASALGNSYFCIFYSPRKPTRIFYLFKSNFLRHFFIWNLDGVSSRGFEMKTLSKNIPNPSLSPKSYANFNTPSRTSYMWAHWRVFM